MMKKMENTRSHSWWWDSHICPKNSKWLQENLSEMDSKVGAMLRIIEEDADSFAQRAEMYYKRRPELINLVEEFYRTYRALVERYTYLTREIRQNFSPAWQAQLGISSESAQNSPVDLHLKKGIDGPDIISPSYSYTGASEFDYDSPTEVSTKGQTDDELSPLGFQTNFERRPFGFKPRSLHMEESSHRSPDAGLFHGTPDVDLAQLQMELMRLQEENKDLVSKSCADVAKMKDLQLDLSSLQSKVRGLEAEDKLTKKRLKSVQEKEQKLEAENLKLSHALISLKEENSELLEEKKQMMEESILTARKIQVLEGEMVGLKAELLASHSHWFESKENLKKNEEAIEELQLTILALEEQKFKDLLVVEFLAQKSEELLNKLSEIEKENAFLTEQVSLQEAELQDSQKQLTDASENVQISEKALHATSQEKACIEQEKVLAVSQVENLQKELERTERKKECLAGDISRLEITILQLEKEVQRLMSEKMEITQHVSMLEQTIEDKQTLIKKLHASCQQYEDRCKDLHVLYEETNGKFIFGSQEVSRLQHRAQTLEDMVSTVQSRNEQLQKEISSLAADKLSLMAKLENMSECALIAECKLTEMHKLVQDKREEIEMLQEKLVKHIDMVNILEEGLSAVSKEKFALVEEQTESLMVHQQLKDELIMLKDQLEVNTTLTEDKLAQLELEKMKLAHEKQQLQLNLLESQVMNGVLLGACEDSKNDLRASEEAAREAQKQLKLSLAEVERLHGDKNDKDAVLCKVRSNIEILESQIARLNEDNHLLGKSIDKYTSSFAALEASNSSLNVRLSESVIQNTILAADVSGKEKMIQELTRKLSNAEMQAVSMKQECESTTAQFVNLQQQISSLEQQLGLQHAEFLESSSKKERLEAIVEEQQNKLSKSNEVKESLIHEKQILMNDVAALRNMNQDLETNVGQLTREKALLQQEISAHLAQCNDLTQKIASFKTAAQKETAVLKGQLVESEEENFNRLLEYEGRLQDLRLKLSEMLAAEASLAEQLVERIGGIRSLEMALLDLQRDKLAMNEDLNCLQQQISSFSTREASLRTEMQNSSDLIDALSTEIERLKQKGVEAEESEKRFSLEQNKAFQNCQHLQQKIDNLQQELVISGEERALYLRDIASHSGRSSELECEVKMLESERDRLQQELSRAQQVEYWLKENLEKLEQETQKLKQMGIEAKESEERFSLEQKRALENCLLLQQKIVNLQQELEISGEERALYLRDIATHSGQSSELECEVKRLESERDCLQQELSRARQVEDRLKENLEKLKQETQNLSNTLDFQGKKMAGQQEELRCLELEMSFVRNEQKIVIEKKDLLVDEKRILEQNLKEREQQLEEAREIFLRLQTNYNELQQVTASINTEIGSKVKEAGILHENMILRQALKSELEHKLNQWSRQALQEDKENALEEMLSVAQQKIMELELHTVNAQKRMIETIEDCRRQGEDIPALMQELAAVSVAKQEWEKEAAKLKDDKLAYRYKLEKLKQELKCIEDQKEQSDFASETAILQRPEGLATLLSLQEQIQSAADLKLELDGRYFKLTAEWGAAEKKLHDKIAEQKLANSEKRNEMLPNHKHVLELEKVCHLLSVKEDLINDNASIENRLKDSQGHLVELEIQLSEHQYANFSVQADAQERIIEAGEECKLHSKDTDDLKQEVTVANAAKKELDKDLAKLQEDRAACSCKFEKLQKELKYMQGQKDKSDLELGGASVQRSEEEEMRQSKMVFLGEEIQKKAEIANEGVTVIQRMLHDLQENLLILEENVRGLKVELEMKIGQNKSSLCLLTDLQMKDFPLASLLKKKFLLLCKALMIVANDWNEKAYDNKNTQIIKGVEKLGRVEALCIDIDVPADDKRICIDYGTNPASDPTFQCTCMLHQLQKRTKEVSLLYDAVEAMLPPSTSEDNKDIIPGNENDESPLHQGQQTKDIGREEVDSIPDRLMHKGMQIMINESKDAEKEVELFEGLAQLHINLGMRLHQALMDEKLENQLKELKEEREKLKDDLQTRVEQVQRMEEELEKLQGFLNGEEGEMADPKQQQQLLFYKKQAEKRARRLSRELVLQRDEVRNLQKSLVTWTEQQELATEVLEKRVFDLVSKECSPNMEGWDADQVVDLMQEMHSHKALTRRHSMDLQSVGQQLQKVGSSIDSTQRQLLEGAHAQDEKANDDGLSSNTSPENTASELMHSHHKVRRFGLAWLLLLWRQSFSEGSPKDRIASSKHSPQHIRRATVLSSLMAHTRKLRCCACGLGSHDGLHFIHGKG